MQKKDKPTKLQRHHYVPKFYLSKWCVEDQDFLWAHTRTEFSEIKTGLKPPSSISFERGLYSTLPEQFPFDQPLSNDLEKNFFSKLDEDASKVHLKLINEGAGRLSVDEMSVWVLFINSLLERRPQRINEVLENAKKEIPQLINSFQRNEKIDSANLENLIEKLDLDAVTRNAVLYGMVRCICDTKTLEVFLNMQWVIITQPPGKDHFLTGDNPIVVNGTCEEKNPIYVMSIALSPTKLLIMHQKNEEFGEDLGRTLAALHNYAMATQTEKYLVSSKVLNDEGHVKNKKILEMIYANRFDINSRISF